ncbi:MAG: ABC transporter substrate-binding protein [Methylobacterium mesophilicum]|nr:ABC transporter substrate-binding protein [Methylobacterium mesophilicum]
MKIGSIASRIGLSVAAVSTTAAFAADIPVTDSVKQSGKLTIASSLAYAPFNYTDENGKAVGLDIELAMAAAGLMGVKLDIVPIPFASQIPALASGRVNIAWTTFTVTPERIQQVDFVTYLQAGTVATVKPENKDKFARKTDLCGQAVAVQTGSSADFVVDKLSGECKAANLPEIKKTIYPEQKDSIGAVLAGRADVWMDDSTAAGYYEKTSNGQLVVTGDGYYPAPLGIAVSKNDKPTADMLQSALSALIADGTYGKIIAKYNMGTSAVAQSVVYTDTAQLNQ